MEESPKPLNNLAGAAISAGVATLLYLLTTTIGAKLALTPLEGGSLATRLSVVVRSALLAVGTGATMIFGVVALGLVLLTIKQINQNKKTE
jgi:Kef-type K+ transport system membrane component KefB